MHDSPQSAETVNARPCSELELAMEVSLPPTNTAELREQMFDLFRDILDRFERSPQAAKRGNFEPAKAMRGSVDNAILPHGPETVISRFYLFVGRERDIETALVNVRSLFDDHMESELCDRMRDWADVILNGLLTPMSSRAMYSALPTPEHIFTSDDHAHTPASGPRPNVAANCLAREHWKCVITHSLDKREAERLGRLGPDEKDQDGNWVKSMPKSRLEACHVIPHAINEKAKGSESLGKEKQIVRGLLDMFDPGVLSLLSADDVDSEPNIICLSTDMHDSFGELKIALEPASDWSHQHQHYRIVQYHTSSMYPDLPTETTLFSDSDIPMPSPRLLSLHAACARVAHMSGAAELIEDLEDEMGGSGVAADGTTNLGDLLNARIGGLQIRTPIF